jgi:hypothetical protein
VTSGLGVAGKAGLAAWYEARAFSALSFLTTSGRLPQLGRPSDLLGVSDRKVNVRLPPNLVEPIPYLNHQYGISIKSKLYRNKLLAGETTNGRLGRDKPGPFAEFRNT